jgi:aminocarboxymuconate-semialdehyde decarboxylase
MHEQRSQFSESGLIVDCHNHAMPETALELLGRDGGYGVRVADGRIQAPGYAPIAIARSFFDPAAKLTELRARSIDAAVVSVNPPLFMYNADPERGEALCRAVNRGLADFRRFDEKAFWWMAHVPLQDPERASAVLHDAASQGAVGVEIGPFIAGRRLDDPSFAAFWSVAEAASLPIFLHPGDNPPYPGLESHFLRNVIGHQLEPTAVATFRSNQDASRTRGRFAANSQRWRGTLVITAANFSPIR